MNTASDQERAIRERLSDGAKAVWDRKSQKAKDFFVGIADDMGPQWAVVAFVASKGRAAWEMDGPLQAEDAE